MLEPRSIPKNTVDAALKQAQHYRLLNEPALAESICRDIVAADDQVELAWVTLLLALADQFGDKKTVAFDQAKEVLTRLSSEFHHYYYRGIILERWARAQLNSGMPSESVGSWIRNAMSSYQMAEDLADANDPNPLLRWNTCVRFLQELEAARPLQYKQHAQTRDVHDEYGDDVPYR